jgi:hypothetical protein
MNFFEQVNGNGLHFTWIMCLLKLVYLLIYKDLA